MAMKSIFPRRARRDPPPGSASGRARTTPGAGARALASADAVGQSVPAAYRASRPSLRTPEPFASVGAGRAIRLNPLSPSLSPATGERAPFRAGEGNSAGPLGFPGSRTLSFHAAAGAGCPTTTWRRAAAIGFATLALALAAGCGRPPADCFQGYIEGEFVHVGSPLGGTLTNLFVARGQEVAAGEALFALESEAEAAAAREAEQRLAQAQARLANLRKGRRPTEIASLEAQLAQAGANLRLAELELQRRQELRAGNVISPAELDATQAARDASQAALATLTAELETARLGAREDEIRAAESETQALAATLDKARWAVAQKHRAAPAAGAVQDTLYRVGEVVAPGNPVVTLLPPANLKARFFVPQAALPRFAPGGKVAVTFDGAPGAVAATVSFVATQAEFTPPVIYSRENRAKLVFMVEARFAAAEAGRLRVGQPVEVRPAP